MTVFRMPTNSDKNIASLVQAKESNSLLMTEAELIASLMSNQNLDELDVSRRILVIGLGGTGCNAIRNLEKLEPPGVKMIACNTDKEDLRKVKPEHRFLIGVKTTRGQGAGSNPDKGRRAMEEQLPQLLEKIGEVDLVMIVAGMGGGTGTGAAPVIAEALRDRGALVLSIVTMPQKVDGQMRMRKAIEGRERLADVSTSMVTILNDKLPAAMNNRGTLQDAYRYADSVLLDGVSNILDVMNILGVENLDYADIENGLMGTGKSLLSVGYGEGTGENAALVAMENALYHPIIEPCNHRSATHGMVNIIGSDGEEDSLMISAMIKERLSHEFDGDCLYKVGYTIIPNLKGIRILIILSGMEPDHGDNVEKKPRLVTDAPRKNLTLVLNNPITPDEAKSAQTGELETPDGDEKSAQTFDFSSHLDNAIDTGRTATMKMGEEPPVPTAEASSVQMPELNSAAVETISKIKGVGALVSRYINGPSVVTTTDEDLELIRQREAEELQRKQEEETQRRERELEIPKIPGYLNKFSS